MEIVADANIPALEQSFGRHGAVRRVVGREISAADLVRADVLVVRSVTRVNRGLLEGTPVRFVGTTTIGVDHLDSAWLEAAGIPWASAPGCNAPAAAEYTLAMILLACRRLRLDPRGLRVGIVGRGNVGARLESLLKALDIPSLACDPPLAAAGARGLVSLDEALSCPVLSLHVPLTRAGRWPTYRMLDAAAFARLPAGALLVNAARGEVVDARALAAWLGAGRGHAALDVWPGEPCIDPALLEAVTLGTPHVAGYSVDGKLEGVRRVYRTFCDWAAIPPEQRAVLPRPPPRRLDVAGMRDAAEIVLTASRVEQDAAQLSALRGLPPADQALGFDRLRARYPERRDHAGTCLVNAAAGLHARLRDLGFQL